MKKNFKSILTITALFSAITLVTVSCSKNPKTDDTKAVAEQHNDAKYDGTDKETDAKFLVDAAEINLEEIKLGQLAQSSGMSSEVRDLGKMMETDHTKVLADLKDLAAKKNITLPSSITEQGEDAYKKLSSKSGKEFDKAYSDMMVDGHKGAISKFEKAADNSTDADIKSWASSMLDPLRTHLDHAIACQGQSAKM